MVWICVLLLAGWALAAFAGIREVQAHRNVRIRLRSGPGTVDINWRTFGPYLLAILCCVLGGKHLQEDYIGYWAVLVAFLPLVLLFSVPIRIHNRRLRRLSLDEW